MTLFQGDEEPIDGHVVLLDPKQPSSVESAKQIILVSGGSAGLPVIAIVTTSSPFRQVESGKHCEHH